MADFQTVNIKSLTDTKFVKRFSEFIKLKVSPTELSQFKSVDNTLFDVIDEKLSAAKSQLDVIKPDRYFNIMNLEDTYLYLKKILRTKYNMQVATNASMKMYEMICQLGLLQNTMRIFCNAEFPGAFLCTIHHYMTTHKLSYTAWASSYVLAADVTLLTDKYGILARHPDMWLMGKKYKYVNKPGLIDGDVTNIDCLLEYEQLLQVDLYTSDAGIDVSNDYNSQENSTLFINYGQILSGLLCLVNGGKLLTKQYTFNNPFNRSIIVLLAHVFENLQIVKPLTSRPGNSEIYLYGEGFIKDKFLPLRTQLLDKLAKKDSTPLFNLCLEAELFKYADYLCREQILFINEIYYVHLHFDAILATKDKIISQNNKKINDWLKLNPVLKSYSPL